MYISQPALTKQIASLEKELGLRLFARDHSGIALTQSGKIMLDCFDRCYLDMDQSLKQAFKAGESERLSVGLLMGLDFRNALECLRLFRLTHPGVNLYRASSDELKEDILTGESDAALLFDNHLENGRSFAYMPLFSSRLMYVLSHDHPLAGKERLVTRDIADCEFIFSNSGRIDDQGIFGHITGAAQALGIHKGQVHFCKNFESIFAEVTTGRVITMVDEYVSFLNDQYAIIPTGLRHNVVVAWKEGADSTLLLLDRLLTYLKRELLTDSLTWSATS